MAKQKKNVKLREYFAKHAGATTTAAAAACGASYKTAWLVRKQMGEETNAAQGASKAPVPERGSVNVSDGSTALYYELPKGAKELQDLISHKNMNAQIGEIFRSTYRYGESSHSDCLRDAKKIRFYIDAEIRRLEAL